MGNKKKNRTTKKNNMVKFTCLFLLFIFCRCKSDLYSDICDCGLNFKKGDLVSINEENQEGFRGDGYKIEAFRFKNLGDGDVNKLKSKGFVIRSQVYIPAISELNSILSYDSTQLCLVRNEAERVVEACIIDTSKKIILAYQLVD